MHVFLDFNSFAYLSDISLAAKSQNKIQKLHDLKGVFIGNLSWLYFTFVLITIGAIERNPKNSRRDVFLNKTKLQIIVFFIAFSGIILCGTSSQTTDIPLFFVAGLILIEYFCREFKANNCLINSFSGLKSFVTILIVMSFFGGILFQDISNISLAVTSNKLKFSNLSQSQQLPSKTLSDLIVTGEASEYPKTIDDGLRLLRRHLSADNRVLALDFANPFSFALELPPPKGDALWWHANYTFSKEFFPEPERVFEEVDRVIIPKSSSEGSFASMAMQEIYGDYLSKHFNKKDESQFWTLLVKP
jgi:hypothetical protein